MNFYRSLLDKYRMGTQLNEAQVSTPVKKEEYLPTVIEGSADREALNIEIKRNSDSSEERSQEAKNSKAPAAQPKNRMVVEVQAISSRKKSNHHLCFGKLCKD